MKATACLFALLAFSSACSDDAETAPVLACANGVTIKEVAIYQGLKRDLMLAGAVVDAGDVPLVAGRDAVVRVFYVTDAGYSGASLVGRLTIDGGSPIEVSAVLSANESIDVDITSTVNFVVPGASVGNTFDYSVSLLEESVAGADNPAARWPAEGSQSVSMDGPKRTLRVVVVPVRYDFDGTGRMPDVSEAVIEQYRANLKKLYPVSAVDVSLREPIGWDQEIEPDGTGWDQVIARLIELRADDQPADDVYYYGVFNPQDTLAEYCFQGCLLGATLLNDTPPAEGDAALRLALGLGYPEYSVDTMAHEIGHAHGRKHANCGSGLAPFSIDQDYPHDEGQIGVWGLDPLTLQLYPPALTSDFMGYCAVKWISDYTYRALFERGALVNVAQSYERSARTRVALVSVTPDRVRWTGTAAISARLGGRRTTATLVDGSGARTRSDGSYYPFDHLPGGLAWVPIGEGAVDSIELEVDGVRHIVDDPYLGPAAPGLISSRRWPLR